MVGVNGDRSTIGPLYDVGLAGRIKMIIPSAYDKQTILLVPVLRTSLDQGGQGSSLRAYS